MKGCGGESGDTHLHQAPCFDSLAKPTIVQTSAKFSKTLWDSRHCHSRRPAFSTTQIAVIFCETPSRQGGSRSNFDGANHRTTPSGSRRYPTIQCQRRLLDVHIRRLGPEPLDASARHDLLETFEERYGRCSIIVTSEHSVNCWHQTIGDATYADAIPVRLVHNAHSIRTHG